MMKTVKCWLSKTFLCTGVVLGVSDLTGGEAAVRTAPALAEVRLTVEPGHPWAPPFGLERVGRPLDAVIEIPPGVKPAEEYLIVGYRGGKEIRRQRVKLAGKSSPVPASRFGRVTLEDWLSEVALLAVAEAQRQPVEIARAPVKPALRAQENQTSSTAANQTLVAACAPQA